MYPVQLIYSYVMVGENVADLQDREVVQNLSRLRDTSRRQVEERSEKEVRRYRQNRGDFVDGLPHPVNVIRLIDARVRKRVTSGGRESEIVTTPAFRLTAEGWRFNMVVVCVHAACTCGVLWGHMGFSDAVAPIRTAGHTRRRGQRWDAVME